MRIAMISDIHGNSIAFDAVLADIAAAGGVDEYWLLGDFFNQGYDPVGVLERIDRLPHKRCVSGNTDRYAVKGGRRGPSLERILADPQRRLDQLVSVELGNGWARGAVTATGWYAWLKDLPHAQRLDLPDGTRLLGVHASLASDEWVVVAETTAAEAQAHFPDAQADLVFAGHAHLESDHTFDGVRYITLGSVANPMDADLRAKYAILTADESGYRVERRRVEFDRARVVAAIEAAHHPSEPWLLKFYRAPTTNKACPVVVRTRQGQTEILAFRHPSAGKQVVKGTIEAGEALAAACARELFEESGIAATSGPFLGEWDADFKGQIWGFHLMEVTGPLQETWDHFTTDGGGHVFSFFWQPLDAEAVAADDDWHPLFKDAVRVISQALSA